ncbi:MAG: PEGA domain-containing protein, partial [Acidobacteria bacterium]|nr:PEGA domain-containing protein [Acidobacteriota bacterium]
MRKVNYENKVNGNVKTISLNRYIMRIPYFFVLLLFLILVFILGVSALFFEKHGTKYADQLLDAFLINNREIFLNGEPRGKSPTEIALPLGRYLVTARLEGYVDWSEEMQLGEARAYPLRVRLEPEVNKARLRVISDPPGADVQVDGKPMGRTPASGEFPTGRRVVQISREGYEAHTEEVSLDEPREYALDI